MTRQRNRQPNPTHQQGYGLAELILAISILSIISLGIMRLVLNDIDKRQAVAFREHVGTLIEQLQKYQYHKVSKEGEDPGMPQVWPATLDNLMTDYPDQFWPTCSQADEQNGLCRRPDGLPWTTQALGYAIDGSTFEPTVKLTFPLSVIAPEDAARWAAEIDRLPFTAVEPNGDRVVTVQNPLISQVYKEFVTRDGNTPLTDAWDVGNQSILNAEAVSVRNQDNTQRRLGVGTAHEFLAQHGDRIYKSSWSCPAGLRQTLHVSVNAILPPDPSVEYIGQASEKPYADDYGSYWQLGLKYYAKIKSTSKWSQQTSGYLNVRLNCSL